MRVKASPQLASAAHRARTAAGTLGRLAIGARRDPAEEHADRIASRALASPARKALFLRESPLHAARQTEGRGGTHRIEHALGSAGRPLDAAVREHMEQRFAHDFTSVRVHTDAAAQRSARLANAHAYTLGQDIVFGSGRYAPSTSEGDRLLAHELAHVVQARAGGAAIVRRRPDPQLEACLEALRLLGENAVGPYGTDQLVAQIFEQLRGVDLADPDNLAPVTQVVASAFPDAVLLQFLAFVEDRAAKERMLQVPSRHPIGPGAHGLFPVTTLTMTAYGELAQSFARSSHAFLSGLYAGLTQARLGDEHLRALQAHLMTSAVLNVVFAPVFLAGAVAGIARDARDSILETVELIGNFSQLVDQFSALVNAFLTDQLLARTLGEETGNQFADDIRKKIQLDPVRFVFEVGCLIGPAIVWTVLSITGITALAAAALFMKLRGMLARFPRVMRIIEKIEGLVRPRRELPGGAPKRLSRLTPARLERAGPALKAVFGSANPLDRFPLAEILPDLGRVFPDVRIVRWRHELEPGIQAQVRAVRVAGGRRIVTFEAPDDDLGAHTIIHETMHLQDIEDGRIQPAWAVEDLPEDAPDDLLIERLEQQERGADEGGPSVVLSMTQRINREVSEFVNAARDAVRWRGQEGRMELVGLPQDAMYSYALRLNTLIVQDGAEFIADRRQMLTRLLTAEWAGLETILEELSPAFRSLLLRRIERDGGVHVSAILRDQYPQLFAEVLPSAF